MKIKEILNNGCYNTIIFEDNTTFSNYYCENGVYKQEFFVNEKIVSVDFLIRNSDVIIFDKEKEVFILDLSLVSKFCINVFRSMVTNLLKNYDKYSIIYLSKKELGIYDLRLEQILEYIQSIRNYSNQVQENLKDLNYYTDEILDKLYFNNDLSDNFFYNELKYMEDMIKPYLNDENL